jgi:hypothetical protein
MRSIDLSSARIVTEIDRSASSHLGAVGLSAFG